MWYIRAEYDHYVASHCSISIKTNLKLPATVGKNYYFSVSDYRLSFHWPGENIAQGIIAKLGVIKPSENEKQLVIYVFNNTKSVIKIKKGEIIGELFRRKFECK